MSMLIYRAGYIEDIEIHKLNSIGEIFNYIMSSRHAKQIRYLVLNIDPSKFKKYPIENFHFPFIITNERKTELYGLEKSEYEILKKRGFIKDGLNISKMISKLIKDYDKVLP